jgi:hypothetical protein
VILGIHFCNYAQIMVYVSFFRTILIRYQVGKGYLNTIEHIKVALSDPMDSNFGRESADQLAISFQASCLLQYGDPLVAEAFLATRWTQLGLTTQSLGSATSSLPESGLEISWESCSKAADDDQGLMLLKYVEIPTVVNSVQCLEIQRNLMPGPCVS